MEALIVLCSALGLLVNPMIGQMPDDCIVLELPYTTIGKQLENNCDRKVHELLRGDGQVVKGLFLYLPPDCKGENDEKKEMPEVFTL